MGGVEVQGMSSDDGLTIRDAVFDFGEVLLDWRPRRALEGVPGISGSVLDGFFSDDDRCGFNYFEDLRDRGVSAEEVLSAYWGIPNV